jgi:hypothetical protein
MAVLAISFSLTLATAQPTMARPNDGQRAYQQYCAVCHGENGTGTSPMRVAFRVPPTDLTGLAKKAGGFPRSDLLRILDQTKPVDAHGSRDLPIWGETFWRPAGEEERDRSPQSKTIDDIISYLESMQAAKASRP